MIAAAVSPLPNDPKDTLLKFVLRPGLGGYAASMLGGSDIDGRVVDMPFVLLAGPNGSGKSAVLRAIRASIGLRGERAGMPDTPFRAHLDPSTTDDAEMLATHVRDHGGTTRAADHVPAVFDVSALGWSGQPTYLFDSRAASGIADKASFDDDMSYHVSLISGGGRNVSHGQFVSKTWWEAIEWAVGAHDLPDPWRRNGASPARQAARDAFIGDAEPSTERWLLIDEPETADLAGPRRRPERPPAGRRDRPPTRHLRIALAPVRCGPVDACQGADDRHGRRRILAFDPADRAGRGP